MTDDRMALIELIEKGADADLVRELLAFASERLMAAAQWRWLPDEVNLTNLRELFANDSVRMARSMANSAVVAVVQTLATVVISALAGYGLAVTAVETFELRHDKYDANRARIGPDKCQRLARDAAVRQERERLLGGLGDR